MRMVHSALFLALVIAGVSLAGVASRETSPRAMSVASPTVVRSANLFGNLQACEIPGLQEHLLAKGAKTFVYAGEFRPTHATPWSTGQMRIFLYVISGTGLIQIGNASTTVSAGDFFVIPKGARHAVSATSSKLRAVYFEYRN